MTTNHTPGMREYACYCRVCRTAHTVRAIFLSGPHDADGRVFCQCGKHTGAEVRAAYAKAEGRAA